MQVNSSSMYGLSLYKSQSSNIKTPELSTKNIINSDEIKVVRKKDANAKIQSVANANVLDVNTLVEPKNLHIDTKQRKSHDSAIEKLHKDIFSPQDNAVKSSLQSMLGVDDFHTRVQKIVHHKEAFTENMYHLIQQSTVENREIVAKRDSIISKSLYA